MQLQLIPFLGYPIVKTNINSFEFKDSIEFIKSQNVRKHEKGDFELTKDAHILQHEELKNLKSSIWNSFCKYVDVVLEVENQFYMCNSWCTYQKTNEFHPSHNHPNAIFSSVYYVSTDKTELQFVNNRSKIQEGFMFEYKVKNFNYFNSGTWSTPVEEGDLLIFPGEINHQTTPYNGKKERMVIGSSYFIQGQLGTDGNYDSINIGNNHARY